MCSKWAKVSIHGSINSYEADRYASTSHPAGEIDDAIGAPRHVPHGQARQHNVQARGGRQVGPSMYIEWPYIGQLLPIRSYSRSRVREHFATNIPQVVHEVRVGKLDESCRRVGQP